MSFLPKAGGGTLTATGAGHTRVQAARAATKAERAQAHARYACTNTKIRDNSVLLRVLDSLVDQQRWQIREGR